MSSSAASLVDSRLALELSDFLEAVHRAVLLPHPPGGLATPGQNFVDSIGHFLRFGPSTNPEAGDGAFLYEGQIEKGKIVTLFPGLVHSFEHLSEVKFDSMNPYLLPGDCAGKKYTVDGRPNGASSSEFARVAREAAEIGLRVNCTWLDEPGLDVPTLDPILGCATGSPTEKGTTSMKSFLARTAFKEALVQCSLGHKVNASTHEFGANVAPSFVKIPNEFPEDLLQYVPTVLVDHNSEDNPGEKPRLDRSTRLAVLIQAARDLDTKVDGPLELFMDFERSVQEMR